MNLKHLSLVIVATSALFLFTGCQSQCRDKKVSATAISSTAQPSVAIATSAAAPAPAPARPSTPATVPPPVRIKAGLSTSITDSEGNVWLADQGFVDGETSERPDVQIANTKSPAIYQSERYSMTSFSYPVPNGKYVVKLHFAETFDGITAPGERVFSFNVEGHEFNDFDVWVKAGGAQRAYVETVSVEVTDGKLDISFTPKTENPEINGIEILPNS